MKDKGLNLQLAQVSQVSWLILIRLYCIMQSQGYSKEWQGDCEWPEESKLPKVVW